jgi:hypothetical protein
LKKQQLELSQKVFHCDSVQIKQIKLKMCRYSYYTTCFDCKNALKETFEQLFDLFRKILLEINGDVNEAINWMTTLKNKYNYTDHLGDFIQELQEKGLIKEQDRIYFLTSKGNRTVL